MTDEGRFESAVDRAIREAAERGAFDDLPGKGKPLPQLQGPSDELWWVRRWVEREGLSSEALLPPSVQLRKELDRLPATLRALATEQRVRDAVEELNARIVEHIRFPSGPHVPIGRVDVEQAVARWRAERAEPAAPPPAAPPQGAAPPGAAPSDVAPSDVAPPDAAPPDVPPDGERSRPAGDPLPADPATATPIGPAVRRRWWRRRR